MVPVFQLISSAGRNAHLFVALAVGDARDPAVDPNHRPALSDQVQVVLGAAPC